MKSISTRVLAITTIAMTIVMGLVAAFGTYLAGVSLNEKSLGLITRAAESKAESIYRLLIVSAIVFIVVLCFTIKLIHITLKRLIADFAQGQVMQTAAAEGAVFSNGEIKGITTENAENVAIAEKADEAARSEEAGDAARSEEADDAANSEEAGDAANEVDGEIGAGHLAGDYAEQIANILASVKALDEKSRHILERTKLINDVAFESNIISLNDALETARAE